MNARDSGVTSTILESIGVFKELRTVGTSPRSFLKETVRLPSVVVNVPFVLSTEI